MKSTIVEQNKKNKLSRKISKKIFHSLSSSDEVDHSSDDISDKFCTLGDNKFPHSSLEEKSITA